MQPYIFPYSHDVFAASVSQALMLSQSYRLLCTRRRISGFRFRQLHRLLCGTAPIFVCGSDSPCGHSPTATLPRPNYGLCSVNGLAARNEHIRRK